MRSRRDWSSVDFFLPRNSSSRFFAEMKGDHPRLLWLRCVGLPLRPGAAGTGIGLYVSRAIVRTFVGELSYANYNGWKLFPGRVDASPAIVIHGSGVLKSRPA